MNKGQITLFIILGIILVSLIFFSVYIFNIKQDNLKTPSLKTIKLQEEANTLNKFMESCIKEVSSEALYTILSQGGFLYLDDSNSIEVYSTRFPYYEIKNIEKAPSYDEYKSAVDFYITTMLPVCLNGFETLKKDFNVEVRGNLKVDSIIKEKDFNINVDYPVMISKGNETDRLNKFSASLNIDGLTPFVSTLNLYNKVKELDDIGLANYIKKNNYNVSYELVGNNKVFLVKYESYLINKQPIIMPFAIKEKVQKIEFKEGDMLNNLLTSLPESPEPEPDEDFVDLTSQIIAENFDEYVIEGF